MSGLHHGSWSQTMKNGLFPWSNLMFQLPWSNFSKKQFTKPLGPSQGVNPMCTKKNDHAPKSECVDFSNKLLKKRSFGKTQVWPFFCLLLSSLSLLPKKLIFLCHGPLPFSTRAHLLPLPPQNPLDHEVNGWCRP
jgi:hypothetical protein